MFFILEGLSKPIPRVAVADFPSWELPDNVFKPGEIKPVKKTKVIKRKVVGGSAALKRRAADEVRPSQQYSIRRRGRGGGDRQKVSRER